MRATSTAAPRLRLSGRAVLLAVAVLLASLGVPALAGAEAPSPAAEDVVPDRVLVKWAPGTPERAKAEGRAAAGAQKIKEIEQLGVDVLRVPAHARERALQGLQRNQHVVYAEADRVVELDQTDVIPNDPEWSRQWSLRKVNAQKAWAVTTGSSSVTVAVLDSGLSPSAEFSGRVLQGRNIVGGNSDVTDNTGHGTKVASVACINSNNAAGNAAYSWGCKLLPVKVMDSTGTMSDVASGVTWATDHGADVINMSLSGSTGTTTLQNAIKYAAGKGALLIASAGNQGATALRYPAAYPEVIGVAGTDYNDVKYSWSNYGPWVDVAAPGQNHSVSVTGTFGGFSGTSSAAPALSGVAALALSLSSNPSAAQVRAALQNAAVPVGDIVKYGRVDALRTLEMLGAPSTGPTPAPEPTASPSPTPSPSSEPEPEPAPAPTTSPAPEPSEPSAPTLTVDTAKAKGVNTAELSWDAIVGSTAEVRRDGRVVASGLTGTTFTDSTGTKGGATFAYEVCGTHSCTESVSATW